MPQEPTIEEIKAIMQTPEYKAIRQNLSPVKQLARTPSAVRQQTLAQEAEAAGISVEELIGRKAEARRQEQQAEANGSTKSKRQVRPAAEAKPEAQ